MRTAGDVLDRLRQILGVKNDTDLAEALGKAKNTISTWRARNTKPFEICEQIADQRGISLDWLLTGEGEMYRPSPGAPAPDATPAPVIPAALAGWDRRIAALLSLIAQLDDGSREAVLAECYTRAETAQQLAALRQAVAVLETQQRA
ncbi:MAG: helix-turn-helix domain containing protein [Chromatiaceae bacterium]|nr:helix-turn-helix domain containing protein [Chromatiaceae bacterium]